MWKVIYHEILRLARQWGKPPAAHFRTQLTFETDRVLIVRRRGVARMWCPECGKEVEIVSLTNAGLLRGLRLRGNQELEAPKWHWLSTEDGSLMICLNSVLDSM